MVVVSTAQTSNPIPNGQLCQAFDPVMLLPQKRLMEIDPNHNMSTSCVAPAYFYVFGSRGESFLCDYHFGLEYRSTDEHRKDSVFEYVFDNSDEILKTFRTPPQELYMPEGAKCWCGLPAEIMTKSKAEHSVTLKCNFHYRKMIFRALSNGVDMEETHNIWDYRANSVTNIFDEIKNVPIV